MLKVSVIIPCKNEEKFIADCVLSVLQSNYPNHLIEIIVVDGISNDSTQEIVKTISQQHNNVQLLENTAQITPVALNMGIKKSSGDCVIILGAHAQVYPDFIKNAVDVLQHMPDVACVGGVIENIYDNKASKAIGKAMSSVFGVGNATFRTGGKNGYVDTVAFGAYRKNVFEQIGYFDEMLVRNQDDEFNFRLTKNGLKIYFSNNIKSKYFVRASYNKLAKQYFQYGYWKVYVNKKVSSITTVRQVVPALFCLYLFLGGAISIFVHSFYTIWLLGLVFYFLASIFFAVKKTQGIKEIALVIYAFFVLHISYGVGYINGIIDFILFKKQPSSKNKTLSR